MESIARGLLETTPLLITNSYHVTERGWTAEFSTVRFDEFAAEPTVAELALSFEEDEEELARIIFDASGNFDVECYGEDESRMGITCAQEIIGHADLNESEYHILQKASDLLHEAPDEFTRPRRNPDAYTTINKRRVYSLINEQVERRDPDDPLVQHEEFGALVNNGHTTLIINGETSDGADIYIDAQDTEQKQAYFYAYDYGENVIPNLRVEQFGDGNGDYAELLPETDDAGNLQQTVEQLQGVEVETTGVHVRKDAAEWLIERLIEATLQQVLPSDS